MSVVSAELNTLTCIISAIPDEVLGNFIVTGLKPGSPKNLSDGDVLYIQGMRTDVDRDGVTYNITVVGTEPQARLNDTNLDFDVEQIVVLFERNETEEVEAELLVPHQNEKPTVFSRSRLSESFVPSNFFSTCAV